MLRGSDLLQLGLAPGDLVGGNGKFSFVIRKGSLLVSSLVDVLRWLVLLL